MSNEIRITYRASRNLQSTICNLQLSMFSKLFLSEKDLEAIQQALFGNPLLASLLMTSPADAFRYLNLMPRFFDALLPPAEDARLVRELKRALDEGRTALDHPQVVRQPGETAPARPAYPQADVATAQADVALSISKAALQRAVGIYAAHNFTGQEFVFPVQRWLDVNARGESIELDLAPERARIVAKLSGVFAPRPLPTPIGHLPRKLTFPIEIELLAGLDVDADDRLYLSVSAGELSLVNPPLPERVARDLVKKIVAAVPSVPLVQAPARFAIPGEPPGELVMRLANIRIEEAGLTLAFQIL
jgi:hypothetical protein